MKTKTPASKPIKAQISDLWQAIENLKRIYGGEQAMHRDYPIMHRLMLRYQNEMEHLQSRLPATHNHQPA